MRKGSIFSKLLWVVEVRWVGWVRQDWIPSQNRNMLPASPMVTVPTPGEIHDWSTINNGSMMQASTHIGATAACVPGHGPRRRVSVTMSARIGPGMEATENPIAYAIKMLMVGR